MSTENINNDEIDNDPAMMMMMEDLPKAPEDAVPSTVVEDAPGDVIKGDASAEVGTDNDPDLEIPVGDKIGDENKSFDLSKFLEQSSEGLIKTEEDFKLGVNKIKEYETLQKTIEDLKAEKETIFANDEIKLINSLYKEGKTQEQIDEYMKLSKLNLGELDPKEVLIQGEIKNGRTREIAEIVVERKYGLDKIEMNDDVLTESEIQSRDKELEIISKIIDSDAVSVRKTLESELQGLKTVVSPTEKALKEAASKEAYKNKLQPFVQQLANDFPKQLVVGDETTGVLKFDVPSEVFENIKTNAFDYFTDQEVTPESVGEFMTAQKALWLYNNQKEILTSFKGQVEVATEKRIRSEYENPQGLPKPNTIPVSQEVNVSDAMMAIANED